MCPGRRAFGSCLVVAPGSVAHGHHNPGAAAPAAPVAGVIAVFGAWGGRQLAYSCRVSSCCLGGNYDHRGATRRRHAVTGVLWSQNPPMSAGWCAGLSVLCSTCSPPRPDAPTMGCLGRCGRRCERRFAMLGACRRASSAWSAWLASSVLAVAGPGANRCRVQKGGTPQGPASNDAISPVGRC